MSTIQETVQRLVAAHNDIKAALVSKGIDVSQSGFESFGNELRSIDSTPHCASVTGLGNESSTSQIYARALDFPTSFEEVTRTINGVPNYFIKIPTMYRKILEVSNGQITAFEMSTVGGTGFEPYPVFIDPDTGDLRPYVLIGVFPFSEQNGNLIPSSHYSESYGKGEIGDMRDLARSLGSEYRIYDVHFHKLFQDLALAVEQKVNLVDSVSSRSACLGVIYLDLPMWIDGIAKTSDNKWVYATDPADYTDSPSSSTTGYSALSYAAPNDEGVIQALGYDASNPFINYPSSISNSEDYAKYYCDSYSCENGTHPVNSTVCRGVEGENGEKRGLWQCDVTDTEPNSVTARLCKTESLSKVVLFESDNEFSLKIYNQKKNWNGALYYSTDNSVWEEWDGTEISVPLNGNKYRLYLRGVGNTRLSRILNTPEGGYYSTSDGRFVFVGETIKCIGNLNNLLDYSGNVTLGDFAFAHLFDRCNNVDFDVTLPSTTLSERCYDHMFYGCTSLTTAPVLPATTLANSCYGAMFYNCTSLTIPPALPATTLEAACYSNMFGGCTSLTAAPELPATTLTSNCYSAMFDGCTSLTIPPALPATTLEVLCYYGMFNRCASLTTVPELPVTTLAFGCYREMFRGCTSLTTIPALPATTLEDECYRTMFENCYNIKLSITQTDEYQTAYRIPSNGVGTSVADALKNMFNGTGGTFTGTPNINTTYYTSNTIIS